MALLTPYWGLDGILLLGSLFVAAYLYMTRKFKYWEKQGIMELPPTPFFGNFKQCVLQKQAAAEFVKEIYERSKGLPYAGFYIFDKPIFLPRDPEIVKNILIKDFDVFTDRHGSVDSTDTLAASNLFLVKASYWKLLRKKLSPFFTSGKLKNMVGLMHEICDELDQHLESLKLEGSGKELEFKDLCANFTTDLIGTTVFGIKVNSLHNPQAELRVKARQLFDPNIFRGFELLSIFFIPDIVKYTRAHFFDKDFCNYMRRIFWDVYDARLKSGTKRHDLVDILLELKQTRETEKEMTGFDFDGDNLVGQAAAFFTGGFETSSTTMSFTLYELAMNPDVQKKLRKEILEGLEETGGKLTYELIMKLPYLDMVISETLRKYPPLSFLTRVANQDYKIPNTNVVLKKGTPVYVPLLGFHTDPEYFPEPEIYDPERFSEENRQKIPNGVYFPFGEGPRTCIGLRLGLIQSKLGICTVLKKYEISTTKNTLIPMRLDPKGLSTTALGGLYMNLRKITTDAG